MGEFERPGGGVSGMIDKFVPGVLTLGRTWLLLALLNASFAAWAQPLPLGFPPADGPVVVYVRFDLNSINDISDGAETFEFTGVLTLRWTDPRQSFDPAAVGAPEKLFQGSFQFDEISPGWYPQVTLVNSASGYETSAVMLRLLADGTATLTQTVHAAAESIFDMRRYPWDKQQLRAVFEIHGFDSSEVQLRLLDLPGSPPELINTVADFIRVPQWNIDEVNLATGVRSSPYAGSTGIASTLAMQVNVTRKSWYARRLLLLPMILIVVLSFCVFWMDRASVGERQSVSFIGILTVVTYQIVANDQMPHVAYFTLMHGFMSFSLLIASTTVVINLVVGNLDRRGKHLLGDRIDRHCRWIFPSVYFGAMALVLGVVALA